MIGRLVRWAERHKERLLLAFVGVNLLGYAADCTLAHWSTGFYHWGMLVSLLWPLAAGVPVILFVFRTPGRLGRVLLHIAAAGSLLVGVAGFLWHLAGQFLIVPRLESLVYSAPLLGPAVLAALGLLLFLYLRPPKGGLYRPLLLLAAASFLGLALMSLQDHAQNGFFHWSEWSPVIVGLFAAAVYAVAFFRGPGGRVLRLACAWAVLLIGLAGTYFHVAAFLRHAAPLIERFALLAPPFAPILLCDAALFALLADLWSGKGALEAVRA
ncbi:MAG TPA: hypothetical protein ENN88_02090 [Candidatus Coatesbacteria bacterium]|nr:hypothetical protein [Candidatus Coatesbacteria bacterium]